MFRHVVLFTWSETVDAERRARSVEALRGLRESVGGMTSLTVADDAGLTEGNADTVLIADFPDVDAYRAYQRNPVHVAVLDEHIRPFLAGRKAVQYEA